MRGKRMTPKLKQAIVHILQTYPAFQDMSAKEIYKRWKKAHRLKKYAAVKILEQAEAILENTACDI